MAISGRERPEESRMRPALEPNKQITNVIALSDHKRAAAPVPKNSALLNGSRPRRQGSAPLRPQPDEAARGSEGGLLVLLAGMGIGVLTTLFWAGVLALLWKVT